MKEGKRNDAGVNVNPHPPPQDKVWICHKPNRPFPNFFKPLPEREAWCTTIHMKMTFHSLANLTHFHMNGCAVGLALMERLRSTRKSVSDICRLQTTDCRLQTADCRLQTADCRLQTTDYRLQTTDYRLHTMDPGPWIRRGID